ncbi:MAG TPA: NAD(P)-dependent oxidoreductase [Gemmatimonadaceae bacterium]|nr:NAD(P)-dependent oxidoreductase [Gemmatimonadaceae bacterium]
MKIVVTGSSGHLGEALVRTLQGTTHQVVGADRAPSPFTANVGTITDRDFVRRCVHGADAVIHTATLHKPHVGTHSRQEFIDTNITGTLNLLEEAVSAGVSSFIFTSTTSAFGRALTPPPGAPAVWVTENVRPAPKNIYGVTKTAAEDLCELHHRLHGLACVVLRTSRFFPEIDDNPALRETYDDANVKANEYLHRRVELQDVVDAHMLALAKAQAIGFARYIISATTPFEPDDLGELRLNAPRVVERRVPEYVGEYARRGWKMFPGIERVYVNERARRELGWRPRYDFRKVVDCLRGGDAPWSALARAVGAKGYHDRAFADGPYPVSS